MLFSFRTHCLSFPFLITHSKNVYSQKSLCYCPTAQSKTKQKKKRMMHREHLSLFLGRKAERQTHGEHLSVTAWPVISLIQVFLPQFRQTDGDKVGRQTGLISLLSSNWMLLLMKFSDQLHSVCLC